MPFAHLSNTPLPFLNRFEKYIVGIRDLLHDKASEANTDTDGQLELLGYLDNGATDFLNQMRPNSFYGLSSNETVPSILLSALSSSTRERFVHLEMPLIPASLSIVPEEEIHEDSHGMGGAGEYGNKMRGTIRRINFKLMQLLRPEAMLLIGDTLLGKLYKTEYLSRQQHFSVVECLRGVLPEDHSVCKLVVFTRTCSEVLQLAQAPAVQAKFLSAAECPVEKVQFLSLGGLRSASQCDQEVRSFAKSDSLQALVVVADLKELTWSQMNYFKHSVDKALSAPESKKKKVVVIAHFPPESLMFGALWDVIFLSEFAALHAICLFT